MENSWSLRVLRLWLDDFWLWVWYGGSMYKMAFRIPSSSLWTLRWYNKFPLDLFEWKYIRFFVIS